MTTMNEAKDALTIVCDTYDRFGVGDNLLSRLTEILVSDADNAADDFRNALWVQFSGGTVSAHTTRRVFARLGRSEEVPDNWV